jgi:hypothetical protein
MRRSLRVPIQSPPAVTSSKVEGSGTIAKFAAVNVARALVWPVKFVIRARIFKSEVLSSRFVENTSRGRLSPLLK